MKVTFDNIITACPVVIIDLKENYMQHYKIGYTNGVFDLLHVGHIQFLQKAKAYCDHLIVAVCDDELAYIHKGKYPIIPVADRMKLLESIKYVDQVVLQMTTDRIIEWDKYHFNAIFHGSDGRDWDIRHGYYDSLKKIGVDSIYFDRTDDRSTTKIVETIIGRYMR